MKLWTEIENIYYKSVDKKNYFCVEEKMFYDFEKKLLPKIRLITVKYVNGVIQLYYL